MYADFDSDPVAWLSQEVKNLLDASTVGLYEFIWLLRGRQSTITDEQAHLISGLALDRLIAQGAGELVLLTWPNDTPRVKVEYADRFVPDWSDPTKGQPYIALHSN
jgi:hypothetical protein